MIAAILIAALGATIPTESYASDAEQAEPPVKKSSSGICHARGDAWYLQTMHFEPFASLDACVKSGGRLPRSNGGTRAADEKALYDSADRTVIRKSRSGICHDQTSPSYGQLKNYIAYATMADCVQSGGRRLSQ